ncbi:hypothetical protein BBK82_03545 [Lentzea guizhouensis]|uniref:Uncharacterized protein n=1 Tax=Lentzea guizhouensis TaxID=1586287 RepID=A0A1B2HC33_9PSEU|nr:hypothetical protein [Lentzea guizhouensis]ANZ35290.1 hypothetical protein BBK82_03545 [Lentzea guizhouensis]
MKTINWDAVRAATPGSVTCNHCQRPNIVVVNKLTGLRAPHRNKPKTQPGQKHPWCDGGNRMYDSLPETT